MEQTLEIVACQWAFWWLARTPLSLQWRKYVRRRKFWWKNGQDGSCSGQGPTVVVGRSPSHSGVEETLEIEEYTLVATRQVIFLAYDS
jgi:hypothetical protein